MMSTLNNSNVYSKIFIQQRQKKKKKTQNVGIGPYTSKSVGKVQNPTPLCHFLYFTSNMLT